MDSSILIQISQVQVLIIKYEEPVILVLGNIGNVINILTFARHSLRKNICSWYFICLSLAHLLLLDTVCLSRIIITTTGDNVFRYVSSLCKFRAYTYELSLLLSRYFLCLISIDRYMVTSSNAWLRQQSSVRVARWLVIIGMISIIIFSIHAPIGNQIGPVECAPPFGSSYAFYSSVESIIVSMVPMLVMGVFSVLTILNVRSRINRQTYPTPTNPSRHTETQQTLTLFAQLSRQRVKHNVQLIRLSFLQVIVYLLLNAVWSISPLYAISVGASVLTDIKLQMMILFLGRLGLNLLFTYTAITFILYTVASKAFRQECVMTFKQYLIILQQRL